MCVSVCVCVCACVDEPPESRVFRGSTEGVVILRGKLWVFQPRVSIETSRSQSETTNRPGSAVPRHSAMFTTLTDSFTPQRGKGWTRGPRGGWGLSHPDCRA